MVTVGEQPVTVTVRNHFGSTGSVARGGDDDGDGDGGGGGDGDGDGDGGGNGGGGTDTGAGSDEGPPSPDGLGDTGNPVPSWAARLAGLLVAAGLGLVGASRIRRGPRASAG